jgi:hypothetical protein
MTTEALRDSMRDFFIIPRNLRLRLTLLGDRHTRSRR